MGLISRHVEATGIPTVGLTSARSITARANPPRAVFADLPLGHTSGAPDDPAGQRQLVLGALEAAMAMDEPGTIAELDVRWADDDWKAEPLSWRRRRRSEGGTGGGGGDTRRPRHPDPQYQEPHDRALAEARSHDEQCRVCIGLE